MTMLKIPYVTKDGRSSPESVWVLKEIRFRPDEGVGHFMLQGWHDDEARRGGKSPVGSERVKITPESMESFLTANSLDLGVLLAPCFAFIKTDPIFAEAEEA